MCGLGSSQTFFVVKPVFVKREPYDIGAALQAKLLFIAFISTRSFVRLDGLSADVE